MQYQTTYSELEQISKLTPVLVDVPGKRYPMSEEAFFAIWVNQYELRLTRLALFMTEPEGMDLSCVKREAVLDIGLMMYVNQPGIVEDGLS